MSGTIIQNPMAGDVFRPRVEPDIVTSLCCQIAFEIFVFVPIDPGCSQPGSGKPPFVMCSRQLITHEAAKNRIVGVLSPQWDLCQQPFPPKSRGTLRKRGQKECESARMGNNAAKQCLLRIAWIIHSFAYLSQDLHNIRPPEMLMLANTREVLFRN